MTEVKHSNCDKTQMAKKTLKNSKCDKTQIIKNLKTKIVTKLKNTNCEKS